MGIFRNVCLGLPFIIAATLVNAQETAGSKNTFYVGGGSAGAVDPSKNNDTPFAIGFMHQVANKNIIVGIDFGGEGTSLDSTWGMKNQPTQATSINLLIGGNMVDSGTFKADAALLVGLRESAVYCPASYLGFRCYADAAPFTEYKENIGGVITLSFDRLTVGLRATGASTQILAGIRF